MEYRAFGKAGYRVSALGFGCMRLPTVGKPEEVDEAAAIEMIRFAIEQGVNYVDTAQPYHGGNSEKVLGKALKRGYRERVAVATKMPVWLVEKAADLDRLFGEQLERMQMKHIDFYLLHNLQEKSWAKMKEVGAIAWMERMRQRGLIGHLGFSFHDKFEVFKDIVDGYGGWEFCQIQYNFVNEDVQAGTKGLEYAAGKGLGVVIMEPLFGGALANPPAAVREVWGEADPAAMSLRWLWNKKEVSVVLSGMSSLEQVKQNIKVAGASGIGALSPAELDRVAKVRKKYQELNPVPCTRCGYCAPCPAGVAIPDNLALYNDAKVYGGNTAGLSKALYGLMGNKQKAEACEGCGECEERCPQKIGIREWMRRVATELGGEVGG